MMLTSVSRKYNLASQGNRLFHYMHVTSTSHIIIDDVTTIDNVVILNSDYVELHKLTD